MSFDAFDSRSPVAAKACSHPRKAASISTFAGTSGGAATHPLSAHPREGGDPGFLTPAQTWIPAFAGMSEGGAEGALFEGPLSRPHFREGALSRTPLGINPRVAGRGRAPLSSPLALHRTLLASLAASTALVGAATAAHAGSPAAIPANMLPQGGHFVAGAGTIGTQGLTETITQSSQRGIIDFNSFSIGKSGTVKINNGTGATLNRVTGGNLSQILGTLSATGSVYLVNPQGVVVGKSGVITTGGTFLASSLDISNQNFMAGQT
ncbi:MAG: filamentous hemagglutinin N-terminal domain-containing protein, partial [Hyphomicrobiales bacterium]|nr:filamentous hemagglutinin N-terminal domain-containing protein [Hyphomicrobiales bacterium]